MMRNMLQVWRTQDVWTLNCVNEVLWDKVRWLLIEIFVFENELLKLFYAGKGIVLFYE